MCGSQDLSMQRKRFPVRNCWDGVHFSRVSQHTFLNGVVSDVSKGVADDLLVVDVGGGRDLAEDHDHASLGASLTSHT